MPVSGVADLVRLLDADKINRAVSIDYLRRSELARLWIGPVERTPQLLSAPGAGAEGASTLLRRNQRAG